MGRGTKTQSERQAVKDLKGCVLYVIFFFNTKSRRPRRFTKKATKNSSLQITADRRGLNTRLKISDYDEL
jgi:hypothetical protein